MCLWGLSTHDAGYHRTMTQDNTRRKLHDYLWLFGIYAKWANKCCNIACYSIVVLKPRNTNVTYIIFGSRSIGCIGGPAWEGILGGVKFGSRFGVLSWSPPTVMWVVGKSSAKVQLRNMCIVHFNNIGPDGPELICHFANKFLYQKCWDTVCVSVCVRVCVLLCVLKY